MAESSQDFRPRSNFGAFVVVADRGMVSDSNLQALRDEGIRCVIAERLRHSKGSEALARADRYKRVTPRLEVKEITREGEERLLVCRNQERAEEDARQRQAILEHLQARLEGGSWRENLQPAARRYYKVTGANAEIDTTKAKNDAKSDGKWVLRTTTDLTPEQVALAYRGLWRVERAFRTLKTPLELRHITIQEGASPTHVNYQSVEVGSLSGALEWRAFPRPPRHATGRQGRSPSLDRSPSRACLASGRGG